MDIAKKAMDIAANTCVYTNDKFQILALDSGRARRKKGEKEKKESTTEERKEERGKKRHDETYKNGNNILSRVL